MFLSGICWEKLVNVFKVIFIRKEDSKPYIDVVLDEDNKILWALLNWHEHVWHDDEAWEAVMQWYKLSVGDFGHFTEIYSKVDKREFDKKNL